MPATSLAESAPRRLADLLNTLPRARTPPLTAPSYSPGPSTRPAVRAALAVESMSRHMSNEGWQVMQALAHAGYTLCGHRTQVNTTDVAEIIRRVRPTTVVIQDKREWDPTYQNLAKSTEFFRDIDELTKYRDIFRVTIVKDAHQNPPYFYRACGEMGIHAWVTYYHPDVVHRLAPYTRREHLIRTYHTIDPDVVPPFLTDNRDGALLSGAQSGSAYPLRDLLARYHRLLHKVKVLQHPGYHNRGTNTNGYLKELTKYKVAICTSSRYGYALRKIIEATACGCRVITDLPVDEILPAIDGNLHRIPVPPSFRIFNPEHLNELLAHLYDTYSYEEQAEYAERAKEFYSFRAMGLRLATDIETMRRTYAC